MSEIAKAGATIGVWIFFAILVVAAAVASIRSWSERERAGRVWEVRREVPLIEIERYRHWEFAIERHRRQAVEELLAKMADPAITVEVVRGRGKRVVITARAEWKR